MKNLSFGRDESDLNYAYSVSRILSRVITVPHTSTRCLADTSPQERPCCSRLISRCRRTLSRILNSCRCIAPNRLEMITFLAKMTRFQMRVSDTHFRSEQVCQTTPPSSLTPDASLIVADAIRSVVRFHLPSLYPRCFRKAFLTATLSPTNCRRSQPVVRTFCPLESLVTKSFRRCQFRQAGITASIRAHKKPKSTPPSLDTSIQYHRVTFATRDAGLVSTGSDKLALSCLTCRGVSRQRAIRSRGPPVSWGRSRANILP